MTAVLTLLLTAVNATATTFATGLTAQGLALRVEQQVNQVNDQRQAGECQRDFHKG